MSTYKIHEDQAGLDQFGNATVPVDFISSDGKTSFPRTLTVYSLESLKLQIQSQLDLLTNNEATVAQIKLGVSDLIIALSPEETKKRNIETAYAALNKAKFDLGLVTGDASLIATLQANYDQALSNYKNALS